MPSLQKRRQDKMAGAHRKPGSSSHKGNYFTIQVKIEPTAEVFTLKKIHSDMKIGELKSSCEFSTGIPYSIQRLRYLDEGDLLDHTDVRSNDIVPGATLHMKVWNMWRTLIEAVCANDIDWVFKLGITPKSDYKTPNSEYMQSMNPRIQAEWIAERAFTALYIAAHRGHIKLVQRLIDAGANVNANTTLGRSALHVASARGHGKVVDVLLERGSNIDATDKFGDSALSIASKFGHKGCERHLFLFRWQERAKQSHPTKDIPLFAHQFHDSSFPVWLKGNQAQVYYTQIVPPGEYAGSALGAPRRGKVASAPGMREKPKWLDDSESEEDSDSDFSDDAFDEKRERRARAGRRHSGMPPIKEELQSRSGTSGMTPDSAARRKRIEKKQAKKEFDFDEWLSKKKKEEHKKMMAKRQEEQKKKHAEDDKRLARWNKLHKKTDDWLQKRQEEIKDKSYEQWLAEKEATKKGNGNGKGMKSMGGHGGGGYGRAPQTAGDLWRQLLRRKQQEREEMGQGWNQDDEDTFTHNRELADHLARGGLKPMVMSRF